MAGNDWHKYQPTPDDEGREMVLPGCDLVIRRDHVPAYFTPATLSRLEIWINWSLGLGLPFAGGWMEQPAKFMDVLDLLIAEAGKHNQAKRQIEEARARARKRLR